MNSITLNLKPGITTKIKYRPEVQMVGVPISTHLTAYLNSDNLFWVPVTRENETAWSWAIPNYVEFSLNAHVDGDLSLKELVTKLNGLSGSELTYFVLAGFTSLNKAMPAPLAEQFEYMYQDYLYHLTHDS